MSYPPKNIATLIAPDREPWPDIDRLTPDVDVELAPGPGFYPVVKVVLDYAAALLLLPVALPLIALAAVAVKLSSPGPAFYTQTRVGRHGRRYRIIKIRTMHHNCELRSGIKWAHKHDERVFRVGKLLRVTHLDELPQLFNVLMGQMSLVGPRPERPEVIRAKGLEAVVPGYRHRLAVRPGVTGLAQLQLPADTDLTSVRHKVVYDLYYVQNQGLLLDVRLVLATLVKAFGGRPKLIRRLFRLPTREAVAAVFHRSVVPATDARPVAELQPA
jgi:lipopolysaccharide/colanic/teichoic acid biosynthesis glycosyltransferase